MRDDVARKLRMLAGHREQLSESEASHLMTLCRKFLEHTPREERKRYPTLGFFCDWSLHVSLDRSAEGLSVLKRLNDTLVEVAPVADNDLLIRRVTEVISFLELRREMSELFQHIEVDDPIDQNQERWTAFIKHLIEIVKDCPLMFGENMTNHGRSVLTQVAAKPIQPGAWVVGVSIGEADYGQLAGAAPNRILCVCVLLSNTTRIVVPMGAPQVFG